MDDPSLNRIWNQTRVPVVVRGGPLGPLVVRLPYADGNRDWLRDSGRSKPDWLRDEKAWSVPK